MLSVFLLGLHGNVFYDFPDFSWGTIVVYKAVLPMPDDVFVSFDILLNRFNELHHVLDFGVVDAIFFSAEVLLHDKFG